MFACIERSGNYDYVNKDLVGAILVKIISRYVNCKNKGVNIYLACKTAFKNKITRN